MFVKGFPSGPITGYALELVILVPLSGLAVPVAFLPKLFPVPPVPQEYTVPTPSPSKSINANAV